MQFYLTASDEKFVPDTIGTRKKESPYKFRVHPLLQGEEKYNRFDVPIEFKASPDTLLSLAIKVVEALPIPSIYSWSNIEVLKWLRKMGYSQYQNTFRENLISGHKLLLIDAAALSAMNITDFSHIRDLAGKIRGLFLFELTKFARSISLPMHSYLDLYKLFLVKTGTKFVDMRRSDLWRHMQLLREQIPNLSHWDLLERWLARQSLTNNIELFGGMRRFELYKCEVQSSSNGALRKVTANAHKCECIPICECYSKVNNTRRSRTLTCLGARPQQAESRKTCKICIPLCSCHWTSQQYNFNKSLKCLMDYVPFKYDKDSRRSSRSTYHSHRISLHHY